MGLLLELNFGNFWKLTFPTQNTVGPPNSHTPNSYTENVTIQ